MPKYILVKEITKTQIMKWVERNCRVMADISGNFKTQTFPDGTVEVVYSSKDILQVMFPTSIFCEICDKSMILPGIDGFNLFDQDDPDNFLDHIKKHIVNNEGNQPKKTNPKEMTRAEAFTELYKPKEREEKESLLDVEKVYKRLGLNSEELKQIAKILRRLKMSSFAKEESYLSPEEKELIKKVKLILKQQKGSDLLLELVMKEQKLIPYSFAFNLESLFPN